METKKYSRRPFDVEAIRVTKTNMKEVAEWCKGEVVDVEASSTTKAERFIQVDVHTPATERQSRAFPGDYVLLLEGGKSFKVYTTKAFNKNFVLSSEISSSGPQKVSSKSQSKSEAKPSNGIKPEAREALRKMSESASKTDETPAPAAPVELAPNEVVLTDEEKAERAQANREAELQVVERPVENTTQPNLEVVETAAEPEKKRKFIQQAP